MLVPDPSAERAHEPGIPLLLIELERIAQCLRDDRIHREALVRRGGALTTTPSPLRSSGAAPARDQSSRAQRRSPTLATGRLQKPRSPESAR